MTVANGASATFAVTATGGGTLEYQWLRNGVPVPQASQASLSVQASAGEDGTIYRAIVRNASGEVRSQAAALRLAGSQRPQVIGALDKSTAASWAFNGTPVATRGFVNGSAAAARFDLPSSISADMAGNLYVADLRNGAVRKISPSGAVSTFASAIEPRREYDRSTLSVNTGLDGAVYVMGDNAYRIDANGTRTLLPVPALRVGVVEGGTMRGHTRLFVNITADRLGNRYEMIEERVEHSCGGFNGCPDYRYFTVRKVSPDGAVREWGAPAIPGRSEFGPGWSPLAMVVDAAGNVYVSDLDSQAIWKLGVDGAWSLFTNVKQRFAIALAVDARGNLYALDDLGKMYTIRKITPDGKVTTVAGDSAQPLYKSDPYLYPSMAVDADDNLWITQGDALIRIVQP